MNYAGLKITLNKIAGLPEKAYKELWQELGRVKTK